jgi:acetolactate synthase-1/2/3 large subunit
VIEQMLASVPARSTRPLPVLGPVTQSPRPSTTAMLTTPEVVRTMNDCCPHDAVFTSDMGEHLAAALHYLVVRAPGDFITCLGFGSMGSGIGSAIGYQMGAPARRVYAICGDGCFLMYGSELATAVQHRAAVTIVVINDSRLNMCEHGIRDQYGASTDMSTPLVDFARMASSMGATGVVVRTREELVAALALPPAGPVVLDVRVDPAVRLEGSQRVASLCLFTSQ